MNRIIAVLIPCFNEETTIGVVIRKFKKELPDSPIYVFDNNSTDKTAVIAETQGAIVIKEKKQGKGHVVSSMFKKIKADIYVMIDGDDTYSVEKVHDLINPLLKHEADIVVGARVAHSPRKAFRRFHIFGNILVNRLLKWIFKVKMKDVMSGYRAFTKDVVDNLPVLSTGFEVETEFTLQALYRNYIIKEIDVPYSVRPEGSFSKLNTFKDGFRVIHTIFNIFKDFKPLTFFGGIGLVFIFFSVLLGAVVVREYILFGFIYRVPSAILSAGLSISGFIFILIGIVLTTINSRFRELHMIFNRRNYNVNKMDQK